MKITTWVNIGSVIVFTLSLTTWGFLVTDYLKAKDINSVNVMGTRVEVIEKSDDNDISKQNNKPIKEASVLAQLSAYDFKEAIAAQNKINIPTKKEGVGDAYVRAKSAVAIDVGSENILYKQNSKQRLQIASLTKLMTALVVVDNISDLNKEIVTIDAEVCSTPTSIIGCPSSSYCFSDTLKIGEQVRANDLLEAMLVNSANDAAVALSKHISGSQSEFAKLMNKKAKEIGLKDTHFCNPSGLDDDNNPKSCYSTAEEIAKIVVYALKNDKYEKLWRIFKVKERWFKSVDGKMKHRYASTNILLDTMENCLGTKTGFTYEAGKTLMMMANHPQDKKIKVVTVILNDPYRFDDAKSLFDWIFESYEWK